MREKPITEAKCPECSKGRFVPFIRDEEFDYDTGNETIKVFAKNVPVERCNSCGLIASGHAAAKVRDEAICRALGLLTPCEIKALRESFGWSQQYLADLTEFGIATVSRWERGRLLQNRSANKVLLALRDCREFRDYLEDLLEKKSRRQISQTNRTVIIESVLKKTVSLKYYSGSEQLQSIKAKAKDYSLN